MRSKMLFLLAIIMGLVTTVLFFHYTNQLAAGETLEPETVQAVQVAAPVAENQLLTADMLKVVEVVKDSLPPQAATELAEVEGKYTTAAVEAGEILVTHRLKDQLEETRLVSRKIQQDQRAVSVNGFLVQSVTNLIEPEDFVDIVLVHTTKDDKIVTKQIFSHIRVLAVGRKMNLPANEEAAYQEYETVTVELTPEDAVKLIDANAKGTLHFTLHSSVIAAEEEK